MNRARLTASATARWKAAQLPLRTLELLGSLARIGELSAIDIGVGLAEALPSGLYSGGGIDDYIASVLRDSDRLNDDQITVFDDVLCGLVDKIEREARAELSRDIAELPKAPRMLSSRMARDDDIDVAMIYENFSPIVLMQLEALGFCGPGEARDFIAEGNIGRGGRLPVNTNGGLLGEGYIHGMNNILEAVRQVRGTAPNQVDGVEHVLVSAGRSGLVLGAP